MKKLLLILFVLTQIPVLSQKELKGIWDLQYSGTSEKAGFDINDPSVIMPPPGQGETTVTFATEDDDLNEELSKTSHDFFKNCWLDLRKKSKFIHNDLVIINGVFGNEKGYGIYILNLEKKQIQFDYIHKKTKKTYSSRSYTYEVINQELVLTSVDNPDFKLKYKKRS